MKFSTLWLIVLATACSVEPATESTLESSVQTSLEASCSVTRIKVNGRFADMFLVDNDTQSNGFLNASHDQITNTSTLDFAYATPDATDPDLVILIQGAGEIPNSAFTRTSTTARLQVTTPFEVTRCEVSLSTGEFICAPTTPRTFDLTWAQNGFATVFEKIRRIETLGPLTTKFRGEFDQRSATVDGTWDGHPAGDANGNLLDTQNTTVMREIRVEGN